MTTHAHYAGEFGPSKRKPAQPKPAAQPKQRQLKATTKDPAYRARQAEAYAKKASDAHAKASAGSGADRAAHALVAAHAAQQTSQHAKAAARLAPGSDHALKAHDAAQRAHTAAASIAGYSDDHLHHREQARTHMAAVDAIERDKLRGEVDAMKAKADALSVKADAASRKALDSGKAADHKAAATAHDKAMRAHGAAGYPGWTAKHDEHRAAAAQHSAAPAASKVYKLAEKADRLTTRANFTGAAKDHAAAAKAHSAAMTAGAGSQHRAAMEHHSQVHNLTRRDHAIPRATRLAKLAADQSIPHAFKEQALRRAGRTKAAAPAAPEAPVAKAPKSKAALKTATPSQPHTEGDAKGKAASAIRASVAPAPAKGPTHEEHLASLVHDAVSRVGPEGRFGPAKVFTHEVYNALHEGDRAKFGGSLDSFKDKLNQLNRGGHIETARADLVGAMDHNQVARSHTVALQKPGGAHEYGTAHTAHYNFVVDRHAMHRSMHNYQVGDKVTHNGQSGHVSHVDSQSVHFDMGHRTVSLTHEQAYKHKQDSWMNG